MKIHCSVLAEDAIKAAIADYQGKKQGGATAAAARVDDGRGEAQQSSDSHRGHSEPHDEVLPPRQEAPRERKRRAQGLRIGIRGGGCTGFSYMFEWSEASRAPEDKVLSFEDGRVRSSSTPRASCTSTARRWSTSTAMMGHGFKFENPNVKGACGCGESVQF